MGAGPQGQAAYDATATELGLRRLNERLLCVMESARMLQTVACLALVPQLPMLTEALRPSLNHWRTTPLAGGENGRVVIGARDQLADRIRRDVAAT